MKRKAIYSEHSYRSKTGKRVLDEFGEVDRLSLALLVDGIKWVLC